MCFKGNKRGVKKKKNAEDCKLGNTSQTEMLYRSALAFICSNCQSTDKL